VVQQKLSDSPRLLRLRSVLEIIPISKSSWWAGIKSGRYPKPVKLGPKITAWRADDIYALTKGGADDL
jgi:prophage regulatory protein